MLVGPAGLASVRVGEAGGRLSPTDHLPINIELNHLEEPPSYCVK
jgi:hypothetical protein